VSPGVSSRATGTLGSNFHIGEPLGDGGHAPVLVEAIQTGGLADMGCLNPIQISFPGGAADGDETPRADGVDGPIFVHPVGKLKMYEVICRHCFGGPQSSDGYRVLP